MENRVKKETEAVGGERTTMIINKFRINQFKPLTKKLIVLLIVLVSVFSCSKEDFYGSGDTLSEFRNVASFTRVFSEGTFKVNITKGEEQSVEITADDNIMQRVRTDVTNGQLRLYLTDGNYNNVHLEAHITVLDLKEISNSGDGDVYIHNNNDAGVFKTINSGAANIYLEGSCDFLDIQNEGSGTILAYHMPAKECKINIQGSGDIEVICEATLNVKIKGSGNVYYKGTPSINTKISGSGKVIHEN